MIFPGAGARHGEGQSFAVFKTTRTRQPGEGQRMG